MLNIQFNVPYKSCRSFFSCPHCHELLNACSRPCCGPCPQILRPPTPSGFCRPAHLQSHFVFVFCFPSVFFFVVFRSSCCHSFFCCFSGFKPLSNASSFLLASPVDGPLISHSLWGFPLCSHIFITAYRCQTKDWLALEGVKSSPVGNCQKYRCTYQHWSLSISRSLSEHRSSHDLC